MTEAVSDLSARKAALRAEALRRRAAASASTDPAPAVATLLAELRAAAPRVVAAYMAMRDEIDPTPAMRALHAEGVQVCVPVVMGKGVALKFREWTPESRMVDGPFGARIPEDGAWLRPDALIVPLVAFDAQLNRLGYGGGFYDRTLAGLRAEGPVRAIGFAWSAQRTEAIPVEATDEPLDAIVTEKGALRR